jgi:serine phosphatase RsbU (regulator of sigma subunit)
MLVAYTDGLVEGRDRSLDVGLEALAEAALASAATPVAGLADRIVDSIVDRAPLDDISLLVLRRHLRAGSPF